jgi:phage shock protein A
MASLFEKVSVLISANLHAMVDQALQSNSLAVIDQYVRQVEENLEDLEDAAATVGGEAKSLKRKLADLQQKKTSSTAPSTPSCARATTRRRWRRRAG